VRLFAAGLILISPFIASGAFALQPLYLCPGNLFSNQLEPAQARAMGCQPALAGRLSQARDAQEPTTGAGSTADETGPIKPETAVPPPVGVNTSASPYRKPTQTVADAAQQRARDSDAKEILRSELARTQAQLQALMDQTSSGSETDSALQRLRADEAALRRELARLPP
jgi:hypothetical protein